MAVIAINNFVGAAPHVKAPQPFWEWMNWYRRGLRKTTWKGEHNKVHTYIQPSKAGKGLFLLFLYSTTTTKCGGKLPTSLTSIESNTYKPPKSVLLVPPYVEVWNPVTSILSEGSLHLTQQGAFLSLDFDVDKKLCCCCCPWCLLSS